MGADGFSQRRLKYGPLLEYRSRAVSVAQQSIAKTGGASKTGRLRAAVMTAFHCSSEKLIK